MLRLTAMAGSADCARRGDAIDFRLLLTTTLRVADTLASKSEALCIDCLAEEAILGGADLALRFRVDCTLACVIRLNSEL